MARTRGPKIYLQKLSNRLKERSPHAGEVVCLRCDRKFESEDRFTNRICSKCKKTEDWQEGVVNDLDLYLGRHRAMPDLTRDRTSDTYQAELAKKRERSKCQKGRKFLKTQNALRIKAHMERKKAKA